MCYRKAFYPYFKPITDLFSIPFHLQHYLVRWSGLVVGLYLFTHYALPLTTLSVAFGSGYPMR